MQDELEDALRVILHLEANPESIVAGRTDAGVHARGQVVHVDIASLGPGGTRRLLRQLNGVLPEDVAVSRVTEVSDAFNARFSALARRYSYRVIDGVAVDPLLRTSVMHHPVPVDVERMNAASAQLLGLNDFSAFSKRTDFGTPIRELQEFSWRRRDDGIVEARVKADAFVHSMVRSLVGGILPVGDGRQPVDWPKQLLAGKERIAPVAPAHGLVLEEVYYPSDDELLARQEITRRARSGSEVE